MKRAYIASVEIEIVVVAESEEAAKKLAAKAFEDERCHPEDFNLGRLGHIPGSYQDEDDLVHHDGKGDMTLKDALNLPGGYKHDRTAERLNEAINSSQGDCLL